VVEVEHRLLSLKRNLEEVVVELPYLAVLVVEVAFPCLVVLEELVHPEDYHLGEVEHKALPYLVVEECYPWEQVVVLEC
jgi:hypothetical protein